MDNADPTAVIILSEILAFETIVIIGFAVTFFLKKLKTIKQLKVIINNYEKNTPKRKASLKTTYSNTLPSENKELDKIIDDLVKHELVFFKKTLESFNKNDLSSINHIEKDIHDLVSPYAQLISNEQSDVINQEKEDTAVPDIDSAIDDLLAEEADDAEGDPALDLSQKIDIDEEIAEIPEELLSDSNVTESSSEDSAPEKNIDKSD